MVHFLNLTYIMPYYIGITPGAYTIALGAGAEAAREFAGIAEKLSFGYTSGCNFFQIDWETLAEYFEPNLIFRIARLINEMKIEWALHGALITHYTTFEVMEQSHWKINHLLLHRDLTYLYDFFYLSKDEIENYNPKIFPHYEVFHASSTHQVGIRLIRELPPLYIVVTPFGSYNWEEFLDVVEGLKDWFKEKLCDLTYLRLVRGWPVEYHEFKTLIFCATLASLLFDEKDIIFNFIFEELGKQFKEGLKEEEKERFQRAVNKIKENKEKLKENIKKIGYKRMKERPLPEIFENILAADEIRNAKLVEFFSFLFEKIDYQNTLADENKRKIVVKVKEFLDDIYERYMEFSRGIREVGLRGVILYDDVASLIVVKFVELLKEKKDVKIKKYKEDFNILKYLDFNALELLLKRYIYINDIKSLDEAIEKKIITIEYLSGRILLNPLINVFVATIYWLFNFIVPPYENLPEFVLKADLEENIKKETEIGKRAGYYKSINKIERAKKLVEFAKLNAFEKIKKICEDLEEEFKKRKIEMNRFTPFFISIETPESGREEVAYPGMRKICHLKDVMFLAHVLNSCFKKISKYDGFAVTIDTEHLLSHAFDINQEIEETKREFEEYNLDARIAVYHIGVPKPYFGTTHIPFDIGSDEHEQVFRYCYKIKDLGFGKFKGKKTYAYLIFERGGGRLPYEFLRTVILAMRKIAEYLEKDLNEEQAIKLMLEESFEKSGMPFYRQLEIIKQHTLDPLAGLITLPEETHTELGKTAIEKFRKRPEEWAREELK